MSFGKNRLRFWIETSGYAIDDLHYLKSSAFLLFPSCITKDFIRIYLIFVNIDSCSKVFHYSQFQYTDVKEKLIDVSLNSL